MVGEALSSSFNVREVLRIEDIGEKAMSRICTSSSPAPVVAVVEIPKKPAMPLTHLDKGLYLALDSLRDPGNIGTILRTADWFGVKGVFLSSDCADVFNPKVVQASMGSIFRVPTSSVPDLGELCRLFRSQEHLPVYGTFLNGENIYSCSLEGAGGLIVMGNESQGVSEKVASEVTHRLLVPKAGGSGAESLNVAVATAVCLSEFRRREW